jgi:hypothetical protein
MKPIFLTTVVLASAGWVAAQVVQERVQVFTAEAPPPQFERHIDQSFHFVSSEFSWEDKIVKNAPYSAEAVTETTQTLADGNRITHKNSSQIYRDGQGRTRREQTLDMVGPWAAAKPRKTIFINDPVAGVNYILEPESKTAEKITLNKRGTPGELGSVGFAIRRAPLPSGETPEVGVADVMIHAAPGVRVEARQPSKNEPLGKRVIEGVQAEGTRSTITIPAGQIGNDRPIEIISERWYSPELQTTVLKRHNDPRTGETVYRLTNLRLGEPGPLLFEPPPDYTVTEEPGHKIRMARPTGTIELKKK